MFSSQFHDLLTYPQSRWAKATSERWLSLSTSLRNYQPPCPNLTITKDRKWELVSAFQKSIRRGDKQMAVRLVSAMDSMGGMALSRIVYITPDWKGNKRLRDHWLDESGVGGSASADLQRMTGSGYNVDRWDHVCIKSKNLLPGKDVTEKVKEALKDSK
jgi:hypothetical protein